MIKGIKAEGENKDIKDSEIIWELTHGELTNTGWWSSKTKNQNDLVERGGYFDTSIKRQGFKMTIAVPSFVSNLRYASGDFIDTYLIKFFNTEVKTTDPQHFIICNQVKILKISHKDFSGISRSSRLGNYKEVLMHFIGGYEFR